MVFGDAEVVDFGDHGWWSFKNMGNGVGERRRYP